jgi:hypothetical protein
VKWAAYVAGRSNRDIVLKGTGLYFGEGGFKFDPVSALADRHHFTMLLAARAVPPSDDSILTLMSDYIVRNAAGEQLPPLPPIRSDVEYRKIVAQQSEDRKVLGDLAEGLYEYSVEALNDSFDKLLTEPQEVPKPDWVAKRDIKTRLAIPYQLGKLLEGARPPSGKTPSIFKMASFLHRRLGRVPPRGRLQSDINLVLLKESYLNVRVDIGILGIARFSGLPKLLPSRREQKRAADVRGSFPLPDDESEPFDNG